MNPRKDMTTVSIPCEALRETEKAYLLHSGKWTGWISKSQIVDETREDDKITSVRIPQWLARVEKLV